MSGDLRLRPLCLDDEPSARAAHEELAREEFPFLLDWSPAEPWAGYVERLGRQRHGQDLPAGWVPTTFLGAEIEGRLVGRASIRHELSEFLENFGGHIGYAVRPDDRGRGFATAILAQSLVIARAEGVERVLVTCDDGNGASARVIERHGGLLEDVRIDPDGTPKRRYWIA